jgi:uncharacterized membrane protein
MTLRRSALAWTLAGCTLAASSAAVAQASYRFELLSDNHGGLTGARDPVHTAINHRGVIVGYVGGGNSPPAAAKWPKKKYKQLVPPPKSGGESVALAINQSGVAVGWTLLGVHGNRAGALEWSADGRVTALECSDGSPQCYAVGISDAGIVVGNDSYTGAIEWSKEGVMSPLAIPDGIAAALANASNANGDVAGFAYQDDDAVVAMIWRDGVPQQLDGIGTGTCQASSLNGADEVVGDCGGTVPVLWKSGIPVALPFVEGLVTAQAFGIDDSGTAVGSGYIAGAPTNAALLWKDGQAFTLNSLIDSVVLKDWSLVTADAINDVGQISGMAVNVHDPQSARPYRLTPVQ